jgi:hypothetical protein
LGAVLLLGAYFTGLLPKSQTNAAPAVAGVWRHQSGVILVIQQEGKSVTLEQHDPASGVTVTGTGVVNGSDLRLKFTYKPDGGTADGSFTVSADGKRLSGQYTDAASGKTKALVFER